MRSILLYFVEMSLYHCVVHTYFKYTYSVTNLERIYKIHAFLLVTKLVYYLLMHGRCITFGIPSVIAMFQLPQVHI